MSKVQLPVWLGSDLGQEERDLFRQKRERKSTKSKGIRDDFFIISDLKK